MNAIRNSIILMRAYPTVAFILGTFVACIVYVFYTVGQFLFNHVAVNGWLTVGAFVVALLAAVTLYLQETTYKPDKNPWPDEYVPDGEDGFPVDTPDAEDWWQGDDTQEEEDVR